MSDLRRTAKLLQPHAPALLLAGLLAGVISGCKATLVWLVREVLDGLLVASDARAVWLLPLGVVGLFGVQGAARLARTWLTRRAALQAEATLRNRLVEHLLARDPAALQRDGLSDSLARLGHDAGTVRTAVGAAVTVVQRPLSALALGAAALWMAPRLALWAALGLPLVAVVVAWTGRRTRRSSERHLASLSDLLGTASDALGGLRTVQAFGAERAVLAEFEEANRVQVDAALRTTFYRVAGPPVVEFAAAVGIAAVIAVGSLQVAAGTLSPGSLVAFLVALGLLNEPLKGIAVAVGLWEEARGGLRRVYELLDRPATTLEPSAARVLDSSAVVLRFEGVCVERGGDAVLEGIDLELRPGDLVVIQGPSGCGKTTLLDLVGGFVQPSAGRLTWNGTDAERLSLASRRQHLACVDQDPWLGAGTVREAIALGRPEARQEELRAAAEAVGLDLEEALRVGDGGRPVSGGERQRVALARALLRDAPVLILDEPTASLDGRSEQRFLETLQAVSRERTVLLVSHRPGPLSVATRAFLVEDGRLQVTPALASVG